MVIHQGQRRRNKIQLRQSQITQNRCCEDCEQEEEEEEEEEGVSPAKAQELPSKTKKCFPCRCTYICDYVTLVTNVSMAVFFPKLATPLCYHWSSLVTMCIDITNHPVCHQGYQCWLAAMVMWTCQKCFVLQTFPVLLLVAVDWSLATPLKCKQMKLRLAGFVVMKP